MIVEVGKAHKLAVLDSVLDRCGPGEISFMAARFSRADGARLRLEFNATHEPSEYPFLDIPCLEGTASGGGYVIECTRKISHPISLYRAAWFDADGSLIIDLPLEWFRFLGVFLKSDFNKLVRAGDVWEEENVWEMISFETVWRLSLFRPHRDHLGNHIFR